MRKLLYLFLICLLFGCASMVSEADLPKLNGYWEIEKVVFPDGNTKDYTVNPMVDYLQLEGKKGFRKKVRPKFNGTYDTSNDAEPFRIVEIEDRFYFLYKNDMSSWREHLLAIDANSFSVVNADGLQYDYKRFEPISVAQE